MADMRAASSLGAEQIQVNVSVIKLIFPHRIWLA
ncbi:hypothetical protein SCOCK_80241 [Actinacidiphila cocklensis]|uniref:Uncharacterized protein n=1 Tax=Actinacidiphila cocklensis TaxID=887465 RepID=A0A9W4GWA7_9ACTN|nr:hypothetical protein SCOCK_80241 [Actinacidiphila cocklensis]